MHYKYIIIDFIIKRKCSQLPSRSSRTSSSYSTVIFVLLTEMDLVANKSFTTQNTFLGSINPDRNHNLRVMSTPEWPVPYYQRAFRHPVSLEKDSGNLNHFLVPLHDFHAIIAKETLKSMKLGYVVEAIENHYDLDTYRTQFKDSSLFSKAYVDDMLDCLSVAFEQNNRILNDFDLGDCLKE